MSTLQMYKLGLQGSITNWSESPELKTYKVVEVEMKRFQEQGHHLGFRRHSPRRTESKTKSRITGATS